eukprot:4430290-Pyramimonas_sp.AAC.1
MPGARWRSRTRARSAPPSYPLPEWGGGSEGNGGRKEGMNKWEMGKRSGQDGDANDDEVQPGRSGVGWLRTKVSARIGGMKHEA